MTELSGPMFEPSKTELWESSFSRQGAHYNIFEAARDMEMDGLRQMFPDGEADNLNFCLFSTSGVHGSYLTIEDAEKALAKDDETPEVTFLIVHPRIVCLRYGNCEPKNSDDIAFLKKLRASSWKATRRIGK